VFDREEAERSRPLGRALDLGCGRHGGVERSPSLICPPAITPGAVTDGSVTNGAVTDGAVTDGDISDGDITLGTITYGAVTATGSGHLYVNGIALN